MVDLYLSLGVMLSLCSLAALAGASLQKRASRWAVLGVEFLMCLAAAGYLHYLWDRPVLSRLLPFSGAIILSNWLPVIGSFFLGVCLKTERIAIFRRVVLAGLMFVISAYSLTRPILGSPPACLPTAFDRTLDFQTTSSTCSAACAANLLRLHGVAASEEEMAELCLTRHGTHWLGVYRGLKLKTAGTAWDVAVKEIPHKDFFNEIHGPGILALSFHTLGSGRAADPESGFTSAVGHSVLVLKANIPASLEVFDPAPDYGFESWNQAVLAKIRSGILLRLVPRDDTVRPVQFDLQTLKQVSNAYPPVARR